MLSSVFEKRSGLSHVFSFYTGYSLSPIIWAILTKSLSFYKRCRSDSTALKKSISTEVSSGSSALPAGFIFIIFTKFYFSGSSIRLRCFMDSTNSCSANEITSFSVFRPLNVSASCKSVSSESKLVLISHTSLYTSGCAIGVLLSSFTCRHPWKPPLPLKSIFLSR